MKEFFASVAAKGPAFVVGQIVGVLIILWSFFIYIQKEHDRILVCKLVSDVLSVLQLILCGAYSGAGVNVVMCAREIVFLNRGKHRWADSRWWLYLFIAFIMVVPFVTGGQKPFSPMWFINALPAFGSGIAVIGLYSKNAHVTRLLSLAGISLWLIYVTVLQNWIQIVSNGVSICSILVGLLGDRIRHKKKNTEYKDAWGDCAEKQQEITDEDGDEGKRENNASV